jgi:CRISPR-associated endonuclease Csn1
MEKTLGIDLGTNSIGLTLREDNEFSWYGVYTFKKGVGEGKSGEFSYAAERTKHRSSRRLYNARRYRKWETLKILIDFDFCPLSIENLNKWKHYKKGTGRVFPINDASFQQWIKLDFDNDGIPDFSSPYQLRRKLITDKLDLTVSENRYKVGRSLFHIAQRRGFKSSRKSGSNEKTAVYKGSNETKTIGRNEYENLIIEKGSLGAVMAFLEDKGIRIRNRYTLRSDYVQEVKKILMIQQIQDDKFSEKIESAIFFQRPLRSQKGLVGKCTLETSSIMKKDNEDGIIKEIVIGKPRCPISHPKFEEYRAWSFINNIKYRKDKNADFEPIPLDLKERIYHEKFFFKSKREFPFSDIRKLIQANGDKNWELNYSSKMDGISVPSCYVSARLNSVFGNEWQNFEKKIVKTNPKRKEETIKYTIEDIWHILLSFEDEENFMDFCIKALELDDKQVKDLSTLFNSFPVGYANLSLKAINNILPFLREGLIYTEAVILAKIPEIIGRQLFNENKNYILNEIRNEIDRNRHEKMIITITNSLIFKYYALNYGERFAWKDFSYKLEQTDYDDIVKTTIEHFGDISWKTKTENEQHNIISEVAEKYQSFFADEKREHLKPPHLVNQIKTFLHTNFDVIEKKLDKIYHPSQIDIYPKTEDQQFLKSPKTAAFKNPMAYKTLYKLRDVINHLIEIEKIDKDTRIVIEIARDLNDANKRWAIETYQRRREAENQTFKTAIMELIQDDDFKGYADPNSDDDIDKMRLWTEQIENLNETEETIAKINRDKSISDKDIQKYRLWKEQNCRCIYTGRIINLTDLFDVNKVDFEHTLPRSKSFDNSLANLTVCYADFNRKIKKDKLPTELNNYTEIKLRLETWEKRIDDLEKQIDFWKTKSKHAQDKQEKDDAIRQRHLRQMEYDYWKNKFDRFTRTEIPQGFINSQLTDTQIITKYAYHYLRTVFYKVDVLKGTNTAQFRKIYSIQPKTEKKDRTKHYHHAIDAAVLTLIPSAKKREEILKKAYEFEEKQENRNKLYHEKPFASFNYSMIEEVQKNILINNLVDKDQTLTAGKKFVRKRGRVVWIDKKNRIPKIAQGDSIRGELHMQTYYGKVRLVERDEKQKPLRDDKGNWKFLQGDDEYKFTLRIPIENLSSLDNLVSPELSKIIESQLSGRTLKKAISENLYMIDKHGNKINRIRRVRVWQAVEPMQIKEQTYKSKKEYKNYYYAKNAENTAFGFYKNKDGESAVIPRNLFEISTFSKPNSIKNLREVFENKIINKKGKSLDLYHVIVPGQKVLFYENNKEELKELDNVSNHLYFVRRLYQASRGNIQFQHHMDARDDKQLLIDFPEKNFGKKGINGFSKFTTDFVSPRLLLSPGNFNFIIEGKDFEMNLDGTITFNY